MEIIFGILGLLFGSSDITMVGFGGVMAVTIVIFAICIAIVDFLFALAGLAMGHAVEKKGKSAIVVVFLIVAALYVYLYFADTGDTALLEEFLQAFVK